MGFENPTPDEIAEWTVAAQARRAILPYQFAIQGTYVAIVCSHCQTQYRRKLLPGRDDPVFVCPGCGARVYIPVEW